MSETATGQKDIGTGAEGKAGTPGNLTVSASPHIRRRMDTSTVMLLVCASLVPTAIASVYLFGLKSLFVIATSVVVCAVTEIAGCLFFGRKMTVPDGSAIVTGILLAFTLPPTTPLWMVAVGGFLAIFVAKQLFGGLGFNIFNPALAARAIMLASWPVAMTTWIKPVSSFVSVDAVTTASPLAIVKESLHRGGTVDSAYSYLDMFLGTVPGSLGETCKITLLIGAVLLLAFRIIDWRLPVTYIATVALLSIPFGRDPLAAVLSGGLILGAFFMATDMVTTPTTRDGRVIFGLGCGILTALIRSYGGFPEGVCYSILFMNSLTPLIDKYVQPRVFGTGRSWLGMTGKGRNA